MTSLLSLCLRTGQVLHEHWKVRGAAYVAIGGGDGGGQTEAVGRLEFVIRNLSTEQNSRMGCDILQEIRNDCLISTLDEHSNSRYKGPKYTDR
jgi:hypothetical protein